MTPEQQTGTWEAERIRATVFKAGETDLEAAKTWWSTLFEDPPDETVTRARAGQHVLKGVRDGSAIELTLQPGRVDLLKMTLPISGEVSDPQSTLGPFSENLQSFTKLVRKWFLASPFSATRIALGAILLIPHDSRIEAYNQLSKFIPTVKIDAENSRDIFYQINRPRTSMTDVKGLRVNRLTKWSVGQTGFAQLRVDNNQPLFVPSAPSIFNCRLELDINTDPNSSPLLPKDKLADIFDELATLGAEISIKGDTP
jgi:hypothetical protein